MPLPYGMRGGWRATFTGAVLECAMRAGFTGEGPATLTEHSGDGEQPIDLPAGTPPCAVMIGHVRACRAGHADNRIEPSAPHPAAGGLDRRGDRHPLLTRKHRGACHPGRWGC